MPSPLPGPLLVPALGTKSLNTVAGRPHLGVCSIQLKAGYVHEPHPGADGKAPQGRAARAAHRELQRQPADEESAGEPRENLERMMAPEEGSMPRTRCCVPPETVKLGRRSQCQLQPLHAAREPGEGAERTHSYRWPKERGDRALGARGHDSR